MTSAMTGGMTPRLLAVGDAAVTVEFGSTIAPALVALVAALEQAVLAAQAQGDLPGVLETVPTFRSLTVLYDPLVTRRAELDPRLLALLGQGPPVQAAVPRRWPALRCRAESAAAQPYAPWPAAADSRGRTAAKR